MTDNLNRKLAAIMFADIVSYSRLMGTNEEEALKLVTDFDNISIPIVEKYHGEVIKKNGDQIFCEFSSAKNAVDASLEIQNELATYNDSRPKDFKLEIRIGIHIGDVVKKENDVFGDGVNVASRIQPLASPGGICISGAVSEALSSHPKYNIVSKGEQELKNILQKHSIFQLTTGHESSDNVILAKSNSKGNYITYIVGAFAVIGFAFFGYKYISNFEEKALTNFYFHITSSPNYINYYYDDWGYGSHHYYPKDEYTISSADNKLIDAVRDGVFRALSSNFAGQGINVDTSYPLDEQYHVNKFIYPKATVISTEEEIEIHGFHVDSLSRLAAKRLDYYKYGKMSDGFCRAFIYKGINNKVGEDSTFYIIDFSTSHQTDGGGTTSTWAPFTSKSDELMETSLTLTEDITTAIVDYFTGYISGRIHGGGNRIGEVMEVLADDVAKIKLYKPGSVKNKMKLSTRRIYHWLDGGAELRIHDFKFILKNLNDVGEEGVKLYWERFKPGEKYDSLKANNLVKEVKKYLNEEIDKIHANLENGFYEDGTNTISDDLSYYLEVIDVIDSTATAKVIGSKRPYYYIRVGDLVEIVK